MVAGGDLVDDDDMPPVEEEFAGTALFAGKGDPARYDLGEFRRLHEPLTRRHESLLRLHYGFSDRLLRLLLDAVRLAEERPEAEVPERSFLVAFLMLASKIVSHAESIRLLTNIGRYGDAIGLARFAVSDGMMLRYLALFPEDVGDWFDLSQLRVPIDKASKRYKSLAGKFWEGAVRKKLLEKGITVHGSTFSDLSEAAHPTAWGLQYYSDMAPSGAFHIYYAPFYDPLPKAQALALMLVGVVTEPIDVFVYWCNSQGLEWHRSIETRWMVLQPEVEEFGEMAAAILEAGMEKFFPEK
jgi:hypothetical protein